MCKQCKNIYRNTHKGTLLRQKKQAQLLDHLLQDYPFLDALFIADRENSSIDSSMHALRQIKLHKDHTSDIHISDMTLTN